MSFPRKRELTPNNLLKLFYSTYMLCVMVLMWYVLTPSHPGSQRSENIAISLITLRTPCGRCQKFPETFSVSQFCDISGNCWQRPHCANPPCLLRHYSEAVSTIDANGLERILLNTINIAKKRIIWIFYNLWKWILYMPIYTWKMFYTC